METPDSSTPILEQLSGARLIDKVHSCTDCPIRRLAIKQPNRYSADCTPGTRLVPAAGPRARVALRLPEQKLMRGNKQPTEIND